MRSGRSAASSGHTNLFRALLLLLGVVAASQVFAQAPLASGKAPVPNVRAPLPQADPTPPAAPAPVDAAARPRSAAPPENDRKLQGVAGVGRVVDGDTLRLEGRTYRLWGIDAPELIQVCQRDGQAYACGREAAAYLRMLLAAEPGLGESASAGAAPRLVCTDGLPPSVDWATRTSGPRWSAPAGPWYSLGMAMTTRQRKTRPARQGAVCGPARSTRPGSGGRSGWVNNVETATPTAGRQWRRTGPDVPRSPFPQDRAAYLIPSNSTSKISVALGGMTPPAPRAP